MSHFYFFINYSFLLVMIFIWGHTPSKIASYYTSPAVKNPAFFPSPLPRSSPARRTSRTVPPSGPGCTQKKKKKVAYTQLSFYSPQPSGPSIRFPFLYAVPKHLLHACTAQAPHVCRASKIHFNALELLVCERTTSTFLRCASFNAHRTMLWLTVLVNNTTKSGDPILDLKSLGTCVNTFALYEYFLQIVLYWQTIQSLPPTITTLMSLSPFLFLYMKCAVIWFWNSHSLTWLHYRRCYKHCQCFFNKFSNINRNFTDCHSVGIEKSFIFTVLYTCRRNVCDENNFNIFCYFCR